MNIRKLTLLTGFGFENFGSRLMLETMRKAIGSSSPAMIEMPSGADWHEWYRGYYLMPNACIRFGVDRALSCLSPGVFARLGFKTPEQAAAVLDISGYIHDNGNAMQLWVNRLQVLTRAKAAGARIVFMPHSLSIGAQTNKSVFRALYELAELIYMRDDFSARLAQDLGFGEKLRCCTDFVIDHSRLGIGQVDELAAEKGILLIIPNFKSKTPDLIDASKRLLAASASSISEVVIVSFYTGESLDYLGELARALAGKVPVRIAPSPEEIWSLLPRAQVCVSARYHGCCLAIYSGVPLITVGWSEKYASLLHSWKYPVGLDEGEAISGARDYYRGVYESVRVQRMAEVRSLWSDLRSVLG